MAMMMDRQRVTLLKEADGRGPVVYWMSRDMRVNDNWALLFAQEMAFEQKEPLAVIFCLVPEFLGAGLRHYDFLLRGLEEVEENLRRKNIPFFLFSGMPQKGVVDFVKKRRAGALITEFDPLRIKGEWRKAVAALIDIPFFEVDAHNIVPCRIASPKQEFSARTFRPKLYGLLPRFLQDFPALRMHPFPWDGALEKTDWRGIRGSLSADTSVAPVTWLEPGEKAARRRLKRFIDKGLAFYGEKRNDPTAEGQSSLSPYLHFGHISAQRVALEVIKKGPKEGREAFLEELIVRKELSDNFCFYNSRYDTLEGLPEWGRKTLEAHRKDKRYQTYSRGELEAGRTHDDVWNASQQEMVKRGKMHGYMRMYWAKKILEWAGTPEEALETALSLNDRYELDGRDPNGYAGILWSIGGLHDRPWMERPIFGKVRFMSYKGIKSKINVSPYLDLVRAYSS
jgi:deoxyribodipyrimidine photo-lyase